MSEDPDRERPFVNLERLRPGDHACLIYRSREACLRILIPYLKRGLALGQQCLLIGDHDDHESVSRGLSADGVDLRDALARGALVLSDLEDTFLKAGKFDPDRMLSRFHEASARAQAGGHSGLRICTDMSWSLEGSASMEDLFRYEAMLNLALSREGIVTLCQYDSNRFPPKDIVDAIRTHPLVVTGGRICGNFYYAPPEEFLKQGDPRLKVERLLTNLLERDQLQRSLAEAEEKFSSLVDNIGMGIALISKDQKVLFLNKQMLKWFPAAADVREPLCHRALHDPPRDSVCSFCPVVKTLQDGLPHESVTDAPLGATGRVYRLYSSPIKDRDGHISAAIKIMEDVTERFSLEEQFRQSQKMEAVGRLAGGVAHDFNNIVTAISGFTEFLLASLPGDDARRKDVEEIKAAGDRATALTRQLLAFSRKQVLKPVVLNLNAAVSRMQSLLARVIGEDVELKTVLDQGLANVRADPGQIEQVIMNLAVNARDAMADGGVLTLQTANVDLDEDYARSHPEVAAGPFVMLSVEDTGEGMNKETLARIFEPFFTTKEKGKGTGLGLSTVYGIVRQSGGSIYAYSEPGKGSVFKLYFPRVESRAVPSPRAKQPSSSLRGTETILLVEDDDMVRKLLSRILSEHGYSVLAVAGLEEALEWCRRKDQAIHLVLSDVIMPKTNGKELVRQVSALRPGIKAIFMSGYSDSIIAHHGFLDPGITLLEKPLEGETVLRKVREALDSR
ncbi:MAG: MEDS domain-containing protein [Elusimicrobia bacterium]|nr:MEDS domain-containing protein [Elusimicrobiota bacterium]